MAVFNMNNSLTNLPPPAPVAPVLSPIPESLVTCAEPHVGPPFDSTGLNIVALPVELFTALNLAQVPTLSTHDASNNIQLGRHWYLLTKGLQTGIFQSWETTSPLVTGVSHAVFYHVPSAVSGWIRYGNALQAGHVEKWHKKLATCSASVKNLARWSFSAPVLGFGTKIIRYTKYCYCEVFKTTFAEAKQVARDSLTHVPYEPSVALSIGLGASCLPTTSTLQEEQQSGHSSSLWFRVFGSYLNRISQRSEDCEGLWSIRGDYVLETIQFII
ncbi:hypothetical protein BS47DRAFT_1361834 [Hydnum rufescens UP504]|uniref:Uncharacterized protein n=1 Tax=Hydnum rufescens UP504 TaxID=1448309 RepID=A0A9P6DUJ3_9AGAM|nr:hypothetical protein BS47DRAFT_1361834 [Hydnum rufescens UP504]